MNDAVVLCLAGGAGASLGVLFFGGLWWTVRRGPLTKQPALWFFGSLMLRTSLCLAGFYYASGGQVDRLVACLLGFVIARFIVIQFTSVCDEQPNPADHEAGHAS